MPENVSDDVASATLEARVAIDSEERLNERLEESDKLIDSFDDKPCNSKDHVDLDPTADATQDDPLPQNFSESPPNPDDNNVIQEPHEKPDDSQETTRRPSDDDHQQEGEHSDIGVDRTETEKSPTVNEIAAAAEKAAATAAASAVALTASVPSAVAVPSIPLQGIQTAAYPSFTSLTPNAAQLITHPLVSMPIPTARRAVRIAPMGVLPLPPHGANPLVSDLPTASTAIMTTTQEVSVDGQIASGTGTSTIGEMPKGKRRGMSVTVVPSEALTPEERTKQKRMLRNRESAARSRDKRKNKNLQLESSIAKHREKRDLIDKSIEDLRSVVQAMQEILKKHNIPVPT